MKFVISEGLTADAREIRQRVFVEEQGFQNEFDETDKSAAHIVLLDEKDRPVATCRVFRDAAMDSYILGRLAVVKEYRGQNIGSALIGEAEKYVHEKGGSSICLHAQCRAAAFYEKSGFTPFGEIEDDEGIPHIWMRKSLFFSHKK